MKIFKRPNPAKLIKLALVVYTIGLVSAVGYTAITSYRASKDEIKVEASECSLTDASICQQVEGANKNTGWVCHCVAKGYDDNVWRCDQYDESKCPKDGVACSPGNYAYTGSCGTDTCSSGSRPIYKYTNAACDVARSGCSADSSCNTTTQPTCGNEGQAAVNGKCCGVLNNCSGTCKSSCGTTDETTPIETANSCTPTWCASFECPGGDTNGDGQCTFQDAGGRFLQERPDLNCPMPTCGQRDFYTGAYQQYGGNWCSADFSPGWPNCGGTGDDDGDDDDDPVTTTCYKCTAAKTDGDKCTSQTVEGTSCPTGWTKNSKCYEAATGGHCAAEVTCYQCTTDLTDGDACASQTVTGSTCPTGWTTNSICKAATGGSCSAAWITSTISNVTCNTLNVNWTQTSLGVTITDFRIRLYIEGNSTAVAEYIAATSETSHQFTVSENTRYYATVTARNGTTELLTATSAVVTTPICPSVCPDMICQTGETCEVSQTSPSTVYRRCRTQDLGTNPGGSITPTCRTSGTPGTQNMCTLCGDGVTQSNHNEQCDDGNTNNNDGCSSTCQNENINNLSLSATADCHAITVNWSLVNQITDVEGYEIELSTTSDFQTVIATSGLLSGSSNSYLFTNVIENTQYYIRVTLHRTAHANELYYTSVVNPVCPDDIGDLKFEKTVYNSANQTWVEETTVAQGDTVAFKMDITNPITSSEASYSTLQFEDVFDSNYLQYVSGSVMHSNGTTFAINTTNFQVTSTTGKIEITNLLQPFNQLLDPGESLVVRLNFTAIQTTPGNGVDDTTNTGRVRTVYGNANNEINRSDTAGVRIIPVVVNVPSIDVQKTVLVNRIYIANNDTVTFNVTITNNSQGNVTLNEVIFSDTYEPNHFAFTGGLGRKSDGTVTNVNLATLLTYNNTTGVISPINLVPTFGALLPGQSIILDMNFSVKDAASVATNTARAESTLGLGTTVSDQDSEVIFIYNPNNLPYASISKYAVNSSYQELPAAQKSYQIGDTVYFRIDIENVGNVDLTSLSFYDNFNPAYLSYVGAYVLNTDSTTTVLQNTQVSSGMIYVNNLVTQLGTIQVGEEISLIFRFTALSAGITENIAIVYVNDTPITDEDTINIVNDDAPGIAIVKRFVPGFSNSFEIGDTVPFQIIVSNTGNTNFDHIYFRDTFDTNYLQFLPSEYNYAQYGSTDINLSSRMDLTNLSSGIIVINDLVSLFPGLENIKPGEVITLTMNFRALTSTQNLPNDVTINTAFVQSNPSAQDSQEVEIENVQNIIDFDVNKMYRGTGSYQFNSPVTFDITILNDGSDSNDVRFEDIFNPDMLAPDLANATMRINRSPVVQFNNLSAIATITGTNHNRIVINNLAASSLFGTIKHGEIVTITIPFTTRTTGGITINEAIIRSDNLTFQDEVQIVIENPHLDPEAYLDKRVAADPDGVYRMGDQITYDVEVRNIENVSINQIRFTDTYNSTYLRLLGGELIKLDSAGHELGRINNILPLANINVPGTFRIDNIAGTSLGNLAPNQYYIVRLYFFAQLQGSANNDAEIVYPNPDSSNDIKHDSVVINIQNVNTDL